MTPAELALLLQRCPTLYHMAESDSWESIRKEGLLSTSSLLTLYKVEGERRQAIEGAHRPDSISIRRLRLPVAVVRDQKPMSDAGLLRALQGDLTPEAWYRLLNERVFFWLTKERLFRLTNAAAYRDRAHDVLELDSALLVQDYKDQITLSPINSGCTKPFPHPRGRGTFQPIATYPFAEWRKKRTVENSVVELCVSDGVREVTRYVRRVVSLKGTKEVRTIYKK